MTEKEITELIVNHISENLFKVIGLIFTVLGVIISSTWFVCKKWFQREIKHLRDSKSSECNILKERIEYLTQKLQDNNSYAKGIIEVAKHQLLEERNEIKSIEDNELVSEYENKIARITQNYNDQIKILTEEKDTLYNLLKKSKIEKTEMLDKLYTLVLYSEKLNYNKDFKYHINLCFNDLSNNQNDSNFYFTYSRFTLLLSTYIIHSFEILKKDKKKLDFKFFNNRLDNLNHTIKIIKPFMYDNDSDNPQLKSLIDKIKKSLNDLNDKGNDKENMEDEEKE